MTGVNAVIPDSALVARARAALALGALDAVTLMERVCALPRAPLRVAERLADALFSRHADFQRDALGCWSLVTAAEGRRRDPVEEESVPVPSGAPATVRARRAAAARAGVHGESDDVSLHDLRYAVVDVETTGTSLAQRDRVTEIAIVHVDGRAVSECYETLVNPERSIPPAIVALTRITQAMVQDAPRFPHVTPEVVGRLRGRIFVAHNASFDWRFVSHEVQRSAGVVLSGEMLCTVRLSRVLLPQLPRRSLDAVTHYFGIDVGARHRAGGDALATAQVLVRLLQLAAERGATTWRGLTGLLQGGAARSARRRSALPRGVDVDPTL